MAKTYSVTPFARFGNLMSGQMLKLGLGPGGMHLLTVTGRKTGTPHTNPVNVIELAGQRWLVAPYGEVNWVRNARAAGVVTLRRGGRVERLRVVEVTPKEAVPVLRRYLADLKLVVGSYFDVKADSPDAAFEAEAPRHPVFRIDGPL
jgi:deazaflavin-dependent oxidoreductase (nitroreductase family)